MTTNQRYGGLNRRFDRRVALLRRFGFKYSTPVPGIAVLTRMRYGRPTNVAASEVMHADRDTWVDRLTTLLVR